MPIEKRHTSSQKVLKEKAFDDQTGLKLDEGFNNKLQNFDRT